jgi:hypothetical protein
MAKYRILERRANEDWLPFGVAYEREGRIVLFAPPWRADRDLMTASLEELDKRHCPSEDFRWRAVETATGTLTHPIELLQRAISPESDRGLTSFLSALLQRLRKAIGIPTLQGALTLVSATVILALGLLLFSQIRKNQALQAQLQHVSQLQQGRFTAASLQDAAGQVTLQLSLPGDLSLPPELAQRVKDLLIMGVVSQPEAVQEAMAQLRSDAGERPVRGKGEGRAITQLSPVATAVKSTRPAFRWEQVAGARSYKLAISQQNRIVWAGDAGRQTEFSLPADAPELKPGEIYSWQVETAAGGELKLSPPARFRVLDELALEEVARIERQFAGHSALALGAAYEQYGLYDDAQGQFEQLRRSNPDSPAPEKMLNALRELRGKR